MGSPPLSALGSLPASSRMTLRPASARRAASVPPPAPDPTTTYSQSGCLVVPELMQHLFSGVSLRLARTPLLRRDPDLEGLQEFDQRALVVVAETGLLFEIIRAEVVAAVDNKIRAFAQFE